MATDQQYSIFVPIGLNQVVSFDLIAMADS